MNSTITLGDAGLMLIGTALLVLIIYSIIFVKNLIITIKNTNKILEDTQVITGLAAENVQGVQKIIEDVTTSVGSVSDIMKGNQSVIAALTSLINAIGSLKNLIKSDKKVKL